jgi:DNA-binding NarL/FixJ family response regulator
VAAGAHSCLGSPPGGGASDETGGVIRLLLADDEAMVRRGLRLVLETEDDLQVVGEAADGIEAIEEAARLRPDVVLMDVRMPRLDGVEACRRLVEQSQAKVVVLTTFDLDEHLFAAVRAGASGFLLKASRPEDLVAAIRAAYAGNALVEPKMTKRLLDEFARRPDAPPAGQIPARFAELTEREVDVLREVVRGASNAEIAERLYISETTVKTHINHILSKLGVRDRIQAVVLAYDHGLVEPGGSVP